MVIKRRDLRLDGDDHSKIFGKSYEKAKLEGLTYDTKVNPLSHAWDTLKIKFNRFLYERKSKESINQKQIREMNSSISELLEEANDEKNKALEIREIDVDIGVLRYAVRQTMQIIEELREAKADENNTGTVDANLELLNTVLDIFVEKRKTMAKISSSDRRPATTPQVLSLSSPESSTSQSSGPAQTTIPLKLERPLKSKVLEATKTLEVGKGEPELLTPGVIARRARAKTPSLKGAWSHRVFPISEGVLKAISYAKKAFPDSLLKEMIREETERQKFTLKDPLVKALITYEADADALNSLLDEYGPREFTIETGGRTGEPSGALKEIICTLPKTPTSHAYSFVFKQAQPPTLMLTDLTAMAHGVATTGGGTTDIPNLSKLEGLTSDSVTTQFPSQKSIKSDNSHAAFSLRGLITAAGTFFALDTLAKTESYNPLSHPPYNPDDMLGTNSNTTARWLFPAVLEEQLSPSSTLREPGESSGLQLDKQGARTGETETGVPPETEGSVLFPAFVGGAALLAYYVGSRTLESALNITGRAKVFANKHDIHLDENFGPGSLLLNSRIEEIEEFAKQTYLTIDPKVITLMKSFLEEKRQYGSEKEKSLYKEMTVEGFIDRLLHKRPYNVLRNGVVFVGEGEMQYLEKGGKSRRQTYKSSVERSFGSGMNESFLEEFLSPEEIEISTFLGLSGKAHIASQDSDSAVGSTSLYPGSSAVFYGCVDAQSVFYTKGQVKTIGDIHYFVQPGVDRNEGLGAAKWKGFFGVDSFSLADNTSENLSQRFIKVAICEQETGFFLDTYLYRKAMEMKLKPFLLDANNRAKEADKKAHLCLIDLASEYGLNEHVHATMQKIQIECYLQIIRDYHLDKISKLEFYKNDEDGFDLSEEYKKSLSDSSVDLSLDISFTDHDAKKGFEVFDDELLCVQYPWHPVSFPGADLDPMRSASGRPFSQRTTIKYMHHPEVNPNISGEKMAWFK